MDLNIDPGLAGQAKIGASALGGAFIHHAIFPAKTWSKMLVNGIASALCGLIFTLPFMKWSGLSADYVGMVGALFGLCGLGLASGLLRAVDKIDFSKLVPDRLRNDKQ